jgi:acyl transferase domain-containing protein
MTFPEDLFRLAAERVLLTRKSQNERQPSPVQSKHTWLVISGRVNKEVSMRKASFLTEETIQARLQAELAQHLDIDIAEVDIHDSFASYGLVSADAVQFVSLLEDWLGVSLSDTLLYDYPNIAGLTQYLMTLETPHTAARTPRRASNEPIAIIGIGCRFPGGADTPEAFWRLLSHGECTVTEVPPERWSLETFYDPDPQAPGKMYTRFGSFISDIDSFDTSFFGLSPREASRMDPQQRLLLEVAWEALERAGISPESLQESQTGVFIGMMSNQEYMQLQIQHGNGDHLNDPYFGLGSAASVAAGRLSYQLNLKGPALTVDTACSSSLVTTHLACQSLREYESDLALVGGVNVTLLPENIVNYCKMGMLSADGRCKTFDESANGFVLGEGCGILVLKRLSDALADRNPILALIRGSAVNQDGRSNGLTAPNKHAQAAVIRQALANAGITPQQVQYVEAHGSGTALGDPIEVDALMSVLGEERHSEQPLLIGSVKTNIGHLAGAAGIAGLIKTVLALQYRELPPHLHVQKPNSRINWQAYPIEIVQQRRAWPQGAHIAGVSSFGWSGTNAHVIVEEAPMPPETEAPATAQLLLLSARTTTALEQATERLITYLQQHPTALLADVAYTTQVGRTPFQKRRAIIARNREEALRTLTERSFLTGFLSDKGHPIAFLFSHQEYLSLEQSMEFYQNEPVFRSIIDRCHTYLLHTFNRDIQQCQKQTQSFIVKYALAVLLRSLGVTPSALFSSGRDEYIAACLSGVLSLEDALRLNMAQDTESPDLLSQLPCHPPEIPFISSRTGDWISTEQATDPEYWITCGQQTVDEIRQSQYSKRYFLVHIGGQTEQDTAETSIVALLHSADDHLSVQETVLTCLGKLWLAGVSINWSALHAGTQRRLLSLPTYAFEKQRCWIGNRSEERLPQSGKRELADRFYLPEWIQRPAPRANGLTESGPWLLFHDQAGLSKAITQQLLRENQSVIQVYAATHFHRQNDYMYSIRLACQEDYSRLCQELQDSGLFPATIIHCGGFSRQDREMPSRASFQALQTNGFYSVLFLAQALQAYSHPVRLNIITNQLQPVTDRDHVHPEHAPLQAACKVIQQEYPALRCTHIDLAGNALQYQSDEDTIRQLLIDCCTDSPDQSIAYRNQQRWVPQYRPIHLEAPLYPAHLRKQGVYLITGGLGGIGLALAKYLARTVQARLVLLSRSALPARETWPDLIRSEDSTSKTAQRLQHLLELEALGAEVLLLQADIADPAQTQAAIQQTLTRFGTLHGVFHAAGNVEQEALKSIQHLTRADCELHFQAKVYGTIALYQALQEVPLDFCLLFSSISAVLGGLGFISYAAGNCFLDSFARRYRSLEQPWISVNWDTWLTDSMKTAFQGKTLLRYAMELDEGLDALNRILASPVAPRIVHSTGKLQERLQEWLPPVSKTPPSQTPTIVRDYERTITTIWQEALGLNEVNPDDNFFESGGNSLIGIQVINKINKALQLQLPNVALFEAPTINALARYARNTQQTATTESKQPQKAKRATPQQNGIAIIGMAGRFPGANSIEQFWENLRNGVETISFFSKEELAEAGVPDQLLQHPDYVRARPILEDIASFDAAFFGYTPRDASLLDPQHRLFLECCWEAVEHAGYDTQTYKGSVGVFGGSAMSTYLLSHANTILGSIDDYQLVISNDKDSLTTTVSYKLNLKGPSVAVQTFCSTSLVAVHLACQSILANECDMALAGGVSVRVPTKRGYLYQEGGMESIDGHCRTFDAKATGSIFGDGVGIVVLKRLSDAIADGDTIHAVIKGSAINNDGSLKVSYSAPSVTGQAEAIKAALLNADVSAESISYVEAHGTATELGDPIEITALTKAFRTDTERQQYCAIGSVKTNVGHLDRAAGVSGLMKTTLALEHEEIPPSLHYQSPNPEITFASSPFYVNSRLTPWPRSSRPRRAMVNSLGMGGTNAHVILEEAPMQTPSSASRSSQLFVLSARSESALQQSISNLQNYLERHPDAKLADVAYTLQVGRRRFEHRCTFVCGTQAGALQALSTGTGLHIRKEQRTGRPLILFFPATDHYQDIQLLCAQELTFQAHFDRGWESVCSLTGSQREKQPTGQVALFLAEYALGQALLQSGITPQAVFGSGIGEYVAACLAGVLTLEDALSLVLVEQARNIELHTPSIPFFSSNSETWLRDGLAIPSSYRGALTKQNVSLSASLLQWIQEPDSVLLTVGTAQNPELTSCLKQVDSRLLPDMLTAIQPGNASFLAMLGQLWLAGVTIDWERFYSQERRHRLPLPTYPFERQHYWIETAPAQPEVSAQRTTEQKQPLKDWFYLPGWKQAPPARIARRQAREQQAHWVFFMDKCQIGKQLITHLQLLPEQVTCIWAGQAFQKREEGIYSIHPGERADYEMVLKELQAQGKTPATIVHLWSLNREERAIETELREGFSSLLFLAQVLGDLGIQSYSLNVLSSTIYAITGRETIRPAHATLSGPCRVIPQEYPSVSCRNIDIELPEPGSQQETTLLHLISAELSSETGESVVALRDKTRWIQSFEPLELPETQPDTVNLRQNGVYMITGIGGLALSMAAYLTQKFHAKIALIGRSMLPARQEWPHILASQGDTSGIGWKIRTVQYLEQAGAELLFLQADVSDEEQMRAALTQTLSTFGTLHGILHTAGAPGVGLIQIKKPADAATVLAPKVVGTETLLRIIKEKPDLSLDFLALFSSITSITGGPGQVDYCAANAFLDACARCSYPQIGTLVSLSWSEWQWNAWEAGLAGYDSETQNFFRTQRQIFGITAEEGAEAFVRVLASSLSHVIVSPQPFQALLNLSTTLTTRTVLQRTQKQQQNRVKHPRPNLSSSYAPPATDLERQITAIWEDLLGIEAIGVNDNFFELGGNSLIGLDLVTRLKKGLKLTNLAAYIIYEAPSIHALAQVIPQEQAETVSVIRSDRGTRRREALRRRMHGGGQKSE